MDLGAGNGQLAENLQSLTGAKFTLLDVIDYNTSSLPLYVFDGEKIPYADASFDQAIIIFVLHHLSDKVVQENLLREAARVTRGEIVIWEDTPRNWNWLERALNKVADWIINRSACSGVHVPHSYRNNSDWEELFSKLNFKIMKKIEIRAFPLIFGGYSQHIYVIRK